MELNRCLFIGNLTRDPESRTTSTGKVVTNFTIAVNNRRGGGGQQPQQQGGGNAPAGRGNEETMYLKVETWGRTAEIAQQYLRKGSQVLVDGRLKLEEYTSREGERRRDPVVVADNIQLGNRPREDGGGGGQGGGGYDRGGYDRGGYDREERGGGGGGGYDRAPREAPRSSGSSSARPEHRDDYDRGPASGGGDGGPTEDDLPF